MKKFKQIHFMVVLIALVTFLSLTTGCDKDDLGEQKSKSKYLSSEGVFIVNEGVFNAGNGDLSFYNRADKTISNNLFYSVNGRTPGDIPQWLTFHDEKGYLLVNNSNTMEVFAMDDLKSITTVQGFELPFQALVHNGNLYVSQLGSADIARVSLSDNKIVEKIDATKSTAAMVTSGNRLFAANWSSYFVPKPNNTVMVVDLTSNKLVDSIEVTMEPNSMVIDGDGKLWVLSSGGYMGEETPALTCIDPNTLQVLKKFEFTKQGSYPVKLALSQDKNSLYFLNTDIFMMSVNDAALPDVPVILSEGRYFNSLSVDSRNGDVYLSDAKDYQSDGDVYRYDSKHIQVDKFTTGITPSGIFIYK